MNKLLSFVVISFIISGCDLNSKSEPENQKTDNTVVLPPAPASPVNTQPVQQTPAPAPVTTAPPANAADGKGSIYGVWVLQAMNSTLLDPAEYKSGMPYIRFDSATRKISGSTGCRGVEGSFGISGNQLTTSIINLSQGNCGMEKLENAFTAFFSAKKQVYEFRSGLLYFPGGDGKNFTFRKIQ